MIEPQISDNAKVVLEKRYLAKNESGKPVETPLGMFERVARAIAEGDRLYGASDLEVQNTYNTFLQMMVDLEFLPNSPTLMNAGRVLGQLSACFVLPIEDSIESIFDTIKHTAMIHKSGGGTGFSFSRIRPKNDIVASTNGVSSGPVSFMKVFDAATEAIKQGGTRRGANMGILKVNHPDIIEFIKCKSEDKTISNFNISVGLTEEFMKAVENDEEYPLLNPRSLVVVEKLKAREVFDLCIDMAWRNGEPGIIFMDRLNRDNPTPSLGEIESTNPCGEQPLLPYEACNLGSVNLAKVIVDGEIDWQKLEVLTKKSVHFLDNVIDVNNYPLPQITKMCQANRKIGLGVMGFADMLFLLGISYNTSEAVEVATKIMSFMLEKGREESARLAKVRGPFPNFGISTYAQRGFPPLRNATITTIAPTGTISLIAGVSSGIEPIFAVSYVRNVLGGKQLFETNKIFEEELGRRGLLSDELLSKISQQGTIAHIEELPEEFKKVFVCAHDISPYWHVKMQAAFQAATDNAVSKTVNFPNNATKEDVKEVFLLAYKLGCKGVTIYRDGSRSEQVLNIKEVNKETKEKQETQDVVMIAPRERPELTTGVTYRVKTGCGNLFITINHDEKGICEVFATMGKSGGCAAAQSDAIARLISLALRSGVDTKAVIGQIMGLRCPAPAWGGQGPVLSCPDAIAQAIERVISGNKKHHQDNGENGNHANNGSNGVSLANVIAQNPQCPDCGSMLEFVEGCVICKACGYSKCG